MGCSLKDVLNRFVGRMAMHKVHGHACHGWEAEMMEHMVIVMDIGLAGVEHHAVAVKDDGACFMICDHSTWVFQNVISKISTTHFEER